MKKIDESRASALRFFGRQKFVRNILNAAPVGVHQGGGSQEQHTSFLQTRILSESQEKAAGI
ncbi:unnamed protein product [Tetraodon nigroviridis]|nr:unnamed protein product [Tetraodon nigroviridis]